VTADDLWAASAACGLFARFFRPGLEADLLRRCAEGQVFEAWPLPADDGALGLLRQVCAGLTEATLADIERDNTALFIGPEHPVPMWESVWTTTERLLFADCTGQVRQAMARAGLAAPEAANEPADHLALELALLAALLARAGQAVEAGEDGRADLAAARAFLADHPARWADACLAEVGRRAATDFYRGASGLGRATLAGLQASLAAITPS
jgi:TorA maturation chaperone TorD